MTSPSDEQTVLTHYKRALTGAILRFLKDFEEERLGDHALDLVELMREHGIEESKLENAEKEVFDELRSKLPTKLKPKLEWAQKAMNFVEATPEEGMRMVGSEPNWSPNFKGIYPVEASRMFMNHLIKAANMLDTVGSSAAIQASEGIDAVLQAFATSTEVHQHLMAAKKELQMALEKHTASQSGYNPLIQLIHDAIGRVSQAIQGSLEDDVFGDKTDPDIRPDFNPSDLTDPPTDPANWLPQSSTAGLLANLIKVADLLDSEGQVEAAQILDTIIKDAIEMPNSPGLLETREELYDAPKHNQELIGDIIKREVDENRKQHHLKTFRGTNRTLSTRYSPDLPGVPTIPVAPGVVQDALTHKVYDFNTGFTLNDGTKQYGGSVAAQTPLFSDYADRYSMFDSKS